MGLSQCEFARPTHDGGDGAHLSPQNPGDRIEIDAQFVGAVEILGADRMRMELEAREVRHPNERRRIARRVRDGDITPGDGQRFLFSPAHATIICDSR